jgi:hypothetical protein
MRPLALEGLVVVFECDNAPLKFFIGVGRHLYLNGFQAYAEVLQLIVVFLEFFLSGFPCQEGFSCSVPGM